MEEIGIKIQPAKSVKYTFVFFILKYNLKEYIVYC